MGKRESAPEVNAGSMADIAFLLLIFFLVTTTIETDVGIERKLPRLDGEKIEHHQRNILSVLIDNEGKLMVNEELVDYKDLRQLVTSFVDNGGARADGVYCDYCQGECNSASSDNPAKAIVSLQSQRETSYGTYIAIQNEIVAAYNTLRNRESNRLYNTGYTQMDKDYNNPKTSKEQKKMLLERIKTIRNMFPLNISEAELKNQLS